MLICQVLSVIDKEESKKMVVVAMFDCRDHRLLVDTIVKTGCLRVCLSLPCYCRHDRVRRIFMTISLFDNCPQQEHTQANHCY